jgi:cell surface protein SprA
LKKIYIIVPLLIVGTFGLVADRAAYALSGASLWPADNDTVRSRYPVRPTTPETPADLQNPGVADLKSPDNIRQEVEYDYPNDRYVVHTKLGEEEIGHAIPMTRPEYMDYTERALRAAYFRDQNRKAYEEADGQGFDLMDMQFSLGPAEKIFGKGGIRVKTQGSGSLSFGYKKTVVDNPTLSEQARTQKSFDFDMSFQLNANASIGSKMNFNLNYNTEATFDFDANQLKLAYDGEEDEIIQHLEAGNVSMTTGSSLISGGASLFGIKTALKFGKLNITALLAKQESSTKTVSSKGGATTRTFEIPVDQYDENRHFFLAHYFRDTYDQNMAHLPLVSSGVEITKIEVWETNKRGSYDNARNVVAFMDLAETTHRGNTYWYTGMSASTLPENKANSLYEEVTTQYSAIRDVANVTTTLEALETYGITGGKDFEKVESARLLSSSEYTLNSQLGYISLKSKLDDDMMLAVAYQYTKGGRTYQVGEFSTDNPSNTTQTLVVKLLKGTSGNPNIPLWDLMMKNVYSLGVTSLQKTNFTLQVQYMSDTVGVYTNYLNAGPIAQQLLIRVMNLDRLNANNESHSDGKFDYVEGYTVQSSSGRIIFPVVEPFGSHLAEQLGSEALADKYCYQELYDSTLTVAEQVAEKNKFRLKGEYTASVGSEIDLGAMNVARGSVKVTAGGATLVENTDYTVDYTMGIVTILNESIIESGTAVSVSLEDQSTYSLQRKTMMGLDLQYDYSKNLQFGATVMNLHEKPLTQKVSMSEIPINNTIYGFNLKWNKDFMWLTNAVGAIPWIKATAPSNFSLTAEYAQLIAGHSSQIGTDGNVLLDDFESSETPTDISTPSAWQLCSTPYDDGAGALFPEAGRSNDVSYGKNRALFSWYVIDRLFTSQSSSLTPSAIKNDLDQLSDHRVRQVYYDEIYPNKQLTYGETGILNVLNLSFYPEERGPYNVDADDVDENGKLLHPETRWGGMMRAMDVTNFENANYEYIEFWMMDPFIGDDGSNEGGDLYFNLGEVSEDILKDGMKSFENGLSVDGDTLGTTRTVWGRVSRRSSTVYAFDNSTSSRKTQDVGLDGLADAAEQEFPTYMNYVQRLQSKVNGTTLAAWQDDPFSPINDPAGDNFHHYRGSDYDRQATTILERYKHYNGPDGNSASTADSPESYSTAAQSTPDVEDINKDNTLNEYERYYQYHISLRPEDMAVGRNCIEAISESRVALRNGKSETVRWYQFRIPLHEYDKKVGSISNFKSIRFMRVFMTGWKQAQTLRLATLELVRSDWRNYTASSLADRGQAVAGTGTLATSTVNIEENAGSVPVNYVLPPGVTRINDPSQSTATQLNEQAMVLAVSSLEPHDALAVYKNSGVDVRRFENLQLFVHGEALVGNETGVSSGDLSVFIRLGSDYKDNYYEYEVPLRLTPAGTYNNNSSTDRLAVWPKENMIDVAIKKFTDLKKERNTLKQSSLSNVSYTTVYSTYDPDNRNNRLSIIGNPTLSEVSVIMIGVRNNSKTAKSARIWVNELRMNGIDESGGWAAKGNATLRVSDLATLNLAGTYTSAGFGSIEQSSTERSMSDDYDYTFSGQTDVGRWLPAQVKLTAPVYYSRAKSVSTPKYDPYNEDMLLDETLDTYSSKSQKDSILELTQTVEQTTSFAVSGMKFDVKSKKAKPWDPANVTLSYSQNKTESHDPSTEYEHRYTWKGSINYNYTPYFTPWTPFKAQGSASKAPVKKEGGNTPKKSTTPKILSEFQLNWLPNSISLSSNLNRTYQEEQLRDVSSLTSGYVSDYPLPVSYSSTFTWLRQTAIAWDVTKTLKLNFNSATNARIDEPDGPVNKELYPDEYQQWKDTIMTQLWKLGTPTAYNQTFDGTWNAPINKIPGLDWTNLSAKYKSSYSWNRGTQIDDATMTGNSLQNEATWQWDGRLNFETLYNKSKFLKKTNDKFRQTNNRNNSKSKTRTTSKKAAEKKFAKQVTLQGDSLIEVKHSLNTRRLIIAAKTADGKSYPLRYRTKDANTIRIQNRDTAALSLIIKTDKPLDDEKWYRTLQYMSRALMLVRSATIGYRQTESTYLPSFKPYAGDFFGQNSSQTASGLAPGLGFAFGFEGGESFTRKAIERDWLICNDSLTTPAVYNTTRDLTYQFVLEPFTGLKINLNGQHKRSEKQSHQFMFDDMAITKSGSFQMTTIALGSSFGNKLSGSYQSDAFNQFIANRDVIYARFLAQYNGTHYPKGGFMSDYTQQAGTPYEGNLGASRINSSDVLVPAFLAAYLGGNAESVRLSPFPKMWQALPNWKVTYDGLLNIFPKLGQYFKTLTLSHAYTCTYNVGSYSTYTNFAQNEERLGFTLDVANDVPIPASEFDISVVSLSESFSPLIGLNATTNSGITAKTEYKQTRTETLNMSAAQIVENISRDLTVGLGYKITDFATRIGMPSGRDAQVNHDLNLRLDVTHKNTVALLRRIEGEYSEATSGNKSWIIKFSADYQLSKMLSLRLYYDKQINTPLVSTSYPTINTDFGITMNFSLTR